MPQNVRTGMWALLLGGLCVRQALPKGSHGAPAVGRQTDGQTDMQACRQTCSQPDRALHGQGVFSKAKCMATLSPNGVTLISYCNTAACQVYVTSGQEQLVRQHSCACAMASDAVVQPPAGGMASVQAGSLSSLCCCSRVAPASLNRSGHCPAKL